jgi:CDP-diacylglycerol--glycerol-3-phosphate 3-phosphatidyltransferase
MPQFVFLSERNRQRYLRVVSPIGYALVRNGVHPNALSVLGLLLSVAAGVIYSTGSFFWAGWAVALAGTCDVLDGQIAREGKKSSRFGAFFDSTLDRFGEIFMFLGLAWYFAGGRWSDQAGADLDSPWAVFLVVLALAGSLMVSYTKARSEALGVECKVGWMQRPERMTLLIIGSLLGALPVFGVVLMKVTLVLLAVLSNVTAVQRIWHVKEQLLKDPGGGERQKG